MRNFPQPQSFKCPITGETMRDPVVDPEGNTYERSAIENWLSRSQTSPITRSFLTVAMLNPNRALADAIESFRQMRLQNRTKRTSPAAGGAGKDGEWDCARCTFINQAQDTKCAACESTGGKNAPKRKRIDEMIDLTSLHGQSSSTRASVGGASRAAGGGSFGCMSQPFPQNLGNELCRGNHWVDGGCANEACRGQVKCVPDCMGCPDKKQAEWAAVPQSHLCKGEHYVDGGCANEACRRRVKCVTSCMGCPDKKQAEWAAVPLSQLCKGAHYVDGGCANEACRRRVKCVSSCMGCPDKKQAEWASVPLSQLCKGGHAVDGGCTNEACRGRVRCVLNCISCPDRPENRREQGCTHQ